MAENFKLAALAPTKDELMVSLGSTAAKLAAEVRACMRAGRPR